MLPLICESKKFGANDLVTKTRNRVKDVDNKHVPRQGKGIYWETGIDI